MALNITPASGANPYVLSIELNNANSIDSVNYDMLVRFSTGVGSCPVPSGSPSETVRDALLATGEYIRTLDVPVGSCGVYLVDIVDLATSTVIDSKSVNINNV